jgi:hypothetical protein
MPNSQPRPPRTEAHVRHLLEDPAFRQTRPHRVADLLCALLKRECAVPDCHKHLPSDETRCALHEEEVRSDVTR